MNRFFWIRYSFRKQAPFKDDRRHIYFMIPRWSSHIYNTWAVRRLMAITNNGCGCLRYCCVGDTWRGEHMVYSYMTNQDSTQVGTTANLIQVNIGKLVSVAGPLWKHPLVQTKQANTRRGTRSCLWHPIHLTEQAIHSIFKFMATKFIPQDKHVNFMQDFKIKAFCVWTIPTIHLSKNCFFMW